MNLFIFNSNDLPVYNERKVIEIRKSMKYHANIKIYCVPFAIILSLFIVGDIVVFHILKNGLDHYYGLDKSAQILCVGHSHTVLGLDTERIQTELGVPVSKYAMSGANVLDRYYMIQHFLNRNPSVHTVVYDVDPRLFDSEGLSSASYTLFFPYIDEPIIKEFLRKESKWQEFITARMIRCSRFRDQTLKTAIQGFFGKSERKKTQRVRVEYMKGWLEREENRKIHIDQESLKCFLTTIEYLKKKGISVYLVYIPTIDLLNSIDSDTQKTIIKLFKNLADQDKTVTFLNYNENCQYRHELFYDLRHLNKDGNDLISGWLIKDLKKSSSKN
jgi:hypothetical protein